MKRTMTMTTVWIAAAAVVAGGATTALATSGGSPGANVLTQAQVRTELAKQQKPADTRLKVTGKATQQAGGEWAIKLDVGTIYVRCEGGRKVDQVTTYRAVAKSGYQVSIERAALWLPAKGKPPVRFYGAEPSVLAIFAKKAPTEVGEVIGYRVSCQNGRPVESGK